MVIWGFTTQLWVLVRNVLFKKILIVTKNCEIRLATVYAPSAIQYMTIDL